MHLINVVDFLNTVDELAIAKELLQVFSKYSNTIQQYDELAMLFEKIKAYSDSLKMLEKCYTSASKPSEYYSVRSNFAKVYNKLNEPLKALYYINLNLEIKPNDPEMEMEKSFSYYLHGEFDKSREIQSNLLLNPDISDDVKTRISFNMGSFDMDKGLFKQGMEKMILGGKKIGIWPTLKKPFDFWDGSNTNKTLLVYAEAGIGDQIIHIRFMNELKRRKINAIWIGGDNSIREVFKFNGYNVLDNDKTLDPFEEYIYTDSTSLPVLLQIDLNELWRGTYLNVDEKYVEKWKAILPKKFVTLRWNGNTLYDQDLHRQLPFDQLFNAVKNNIADDIEIVSLQIDENGKNVDGLINVQIDNWFDTMAIQKLALLNITSCTSTAHSAAACGSSCIVFPPICTYYPWIYLKENNNSYWYGPNLKAFVQIKWKNWDIPLDLLRKELEVLNAQ